ncbi:hypothetical protein M514_00281 [Trichuris suis]|uniref:Translation initiation factor eIF2B subunit beta n=1 Tax=Trichuris suis TaxID=68888 RepID=A0A085NEI3_9BILA|nr:hypothetical protein M513_00281 [Trichuris suis]KFD67879.1 hypothetical protein M514_00281 [Trichuris suis]KHJ46057.1 initiation factor, subunit 2 family protein [Trichuris suis]
MARATADGLPISASLQFINDIRYGKITGSYNIAHATVCFARKIIATRKWSSVDGLLQMLQAECRMMAECLPKQLIVTNMIRRILKMIRDEVVREPTAGEPLQESLQKLWLGDGSFKETASAKEWKTLIIENVSEFLAELETCGDNISAQAEDHIKSGDTVMTLSYSKTVESFLKAAAVRQRFTVIVAQCAPLNKGLLLAEALKNCKTIRVQVISDSAIFSSMSQTSKVIIGTEEVLGDGSLRAVAGTYSLCLSAHYFRVPVIVCSPFYKLTPTFLSESNQEDFNELRSPMELVPFKEAEIVCKSEICNPAFDLVPSHLITLLITNVSGNAPSYIYRLINELYHPKDALCDG